MSAFWKINWRAALWVICLGVPLGLEAQLAADFSSDIVSGCAPIVVTFSDQSSGTVTKYEWDFTVGTADTANPVVSFLNPGVYDVQLIVHNAGGTTDTLLKPGYITVFKNPKAAFSGSPTGGCVPLNTQFTDLSTPGDAPISSWLWDLGNGSTPSVQHPLGTYTFAGQFPVSLQVEDLNGCINTTLKPAYVKTTAKPKASFAYSPVYGCGSSLNVNFNSTSTGAQPLSFEWKFGDGGQASGNPVAHTYTQHGTYDVQLIVTDASGCTDTATGSKVYFAPYHAKIGVDKLAACVAQVGDSFHFINLSTPIPVNERWDFGDGTPPTQQPNPTHGYQQPGLYTVQLISGTTGCRDTATIVVAVQPDRVKPDVQPEFGCDAPHTISFADTSTGLVAWRWNFGDGDSGTAKSGTHGYGAGSYDIRVIGTDSVGCHDTAYRSIQVSEPAASLQQPAQGCKFDPIPFLLQLTYAGVVDSLRWDFGDGTGTSTLPTPNYTYADSGHYDVELVVYTKEGCIDTFHFPAMVGLRDTVTAITVDTILACANHVFCFQATRTFAPQILWDYGDGQNGFAPCHKYRDTGFFTVTAAPMHNGCIGKELEVQQLLRVLGPVAFPSIAYSCDSPNTVQFSDSSIDATGVTWFFQDDTTNASMFDKTFPGRGAYPIMFVAENTLNNCRDTAIDDVVIVKAEAVVMADTLACFQHLDVVFDATNSQDVFEDEVSWNFGNGKFTFFGELPVPQHLLPPLQDYLAPGVYPMFVVVADEHECLDTAHLNIHVLHHQTHIAATPAGGCAPLFVQFSDTSKVDTPVVLWDWEFVNTATGSTLPNPSQTLAKGTHPVILTTTDAAGCTNKDTVHIGVGDVKANFVSSMRKICSGTTIQFTNATATAANTTYKWHFGDGDSSTLKHPAHTYVAPGGGLFDVTLIATDSVGCSDTLHRPAWIEVTNPLANFTASDTISDCPPMHSLFTSQATGRIATWQWSFGDGAVSQLEHPQHNYTVPGVYDVQLIVTDSSGCTDTLLKPKYINLNGVYGSWEVMPDSGCRPLTVTFVAMDTGGGVKNILWDMGDGKVLNGISVTHTFDSFGVFYPKLLLDNGKTGAQKCEVSFDVDTIVVTGPRAAFSYARDSSCLPDSFRFADQSLGAIAQWEWTIAGSSYPVQHPPAIYQSQGGQLSVQLIVTDSAGCSDTAWEQVPVDPPPPLQLGGDSIVCPDSIFQLQVVAPTAVTIRWQPGASLDDSTLFSPSGQLSSTTSFLATVIDSAGCTSSATWQVFVLDDIVVQAFPDTTIYAGDTAYIRTIVTSPAQTYIWTPEDSLSCVDCASPKAYPLETTTYTVTVVSMGGCFTSSAAVTITVLDPFTMVVAEVFTPDGDGVNDTILPQGIRIHEVDFRVYNRFGELMFTTNEPGIGWDGTYRGVKQPQDSYGYTAIGRGRSGKEIKLKGVFTLLR